MNTNKLLLSLVTASIAGALTQANAAEYSLYESHIQTTKGSSSKQTADCRLEEKGKQNSLRADIFSKRIHNIYNFIKLLKEECNKKSHSKTTMKEKDPLNNEESLYKNANTEIDALKKLLFLANDEILEKIKTNETFIFVLNRINENRRSIAPLLPENIIANETYLILNEYHLCD